MSQAEADAIRRQKKESHATKFTAQGFGMAFGASAVPALPDPAKLAMPQVHYPPTSIHPPPLPSASQPEPPPPPPDDDMFGHEPEVKPEVLPKKETPIKKPKDEDDDLIDWAEKQCLLCRRAFSRGSKFLARVQDLNFKL